MLMTDLSLNGSLTEYLRTQWSADIISL